jgi:predicted dinucleotide-binding enzyme
LAYISDNHFPAATFRAHITSRFSNQKSKTPASSTTAESNAQAPELATQACFDALDRGEQ